MQSLCENSFTVRQYYLDTCFWCFPSIKLQFWPIYESLLSIFIITMKLLASLISFLSPLIEVSDEWSTIMFSERTLWCCVSLPGPHVLFVRLWGNIFDTSLTAGLNFISTLQCHQSYACHTDHKSRWNNYSSPTGEAYHLSSCLLLFMCQLKMYKTPFHA